MNSHKRLMTTLNHKEPDKVPIDLGGNNTGIHIVAYKNLIEYLGIEDDDIRFNNLAGYTAHPCEALLERFEVDIRWLHPVSDLVSENYVPEVVGKYRGYFDWFGVFWGEDAEKPVEDILYYSPVVHPFSEITTVQQVREYEWPDGKTRGYFRGLRDRVRKLKEKGLAIGVRPMGILWDYVTWLFGFTKTMKHLHKNPELIIAALEGLEKVWLDHISTFLNKVKFGDEHYVDVIELMGDLGTQSGPMMNPEKKYAPIIKPIELRFARKVKSIAKIKINYHCCGSISKFIPHFIDIGYDATNPVQIGAADMEPCSLKKRFGSDISFWGGLCDSQKTLPHGSPEKIRQEVKRNFDCFKSGGGYVAGPIHNITSEAPPENIVAMFDAAKEFREY